MTKTEILLMVLFGSLSLVALHFGILDGIPLDMLIMGSMQ